MEDMKVTATGYDFRSAHAAMQRYVDGNLLSGFSSAVLVGRDLVDVNLPHAGAQGPIMVTRRKLFMGVCISIAFAAARVQAAEPSARSFVEAIYAAYKGKDSNGVLLDTDAAVRRYFEPKLAALIIEDDKEARGEIGKLDFDPFIDAQDWEIDSVDIALREVAPDKASATVSFKNLGEPHSVVLDLVKLKAGWRIADITWDRKHRLGEDTLRGILTKK